MSRTEGAWFECVGYGWHCIRSADEVICDMRFIGGAANEDNAHLVAAAPELLEALEKSMNFIANTESEIGDTLECGDMARAAIAKAKGKTNV